MSLKSANNNLEKSLAIIMCSKNGASFINEQLYSIKNQTYQDFDIYISDNLSRDTTKKIINSFKIFYCIARNTFYKFNII